MSIILLEFERTGCSESAAGVTFECASLVSEILVLEDGVVTTFIIECILCVKIVYGTV